MLGVGPAGGRRLALPPGGVDAPAVLEHVRGITQRLRQAGCFASWMVVSENEVVGLCGYHRPPENGRIEIGYGVAESRRGRGHATRAVAAMLQAAEADPNVQVVVAETSVSNPASARVLEKNGFVQTGNRFDAEDGEVVTWQKSVN